MGVTAQGQGDPGVGCGDGRTRLMRQQQARTLGGAGEYGVHIGRVSPVPGKSFGAGRIGQAADDEAGVATGDHTVAVTHQLQAKIIDLRHPRDRVPVVVVIPGTEPETQRRRQLRQWGDLVGKVVNGAVRQVSGETDEIWLQIADGLYQGFNKWSANRRSYVQI